MVSPKDYSIGTNLSKNFKGRSDTDTKKLYEIIEQAVEIARLKSNLRSDQALNFLLEIFMPHISRVAYNIYSKLVGFTEKADVVQESIIVFINLLDKYDKTKSAFPYYIGQMLPKYMHKWYIKEKEKCDRLPENISFFESFSDPILNIADPMLKNPGAVIDYLNNIILEQEYIKYVKKLGERKSRSKTIKKVCYQHFLEGETCKQIAIEQEISYHAVYEVIDKIKVDLLQFFNESIYIDMEDFNKK